MLTSVPHPISPIRKQYFIRLVFRCMVFLCCLACFFIYPQVFSVIDGTNFFKGFSPLHLLWIIWVFDMLLQIVPIKNRLPLGSQKLFANRFKPIRDKINYQVLKDHIHSTTNAAYKVLILWGVLIAALGFLLYIKALDKNWMFMISVLFYVCDLICVLIWCPFRLIMKNKCCTTCRIFNWDHLMMFSPMIFIGGVYCFSLLFMAFVAWLIWELCVLIYPERFSEITNVSLKCSECTDKLCTQYCQKLKQDKHLSKN